MQLEQETLDMYTDQTSRSSSVTNVAFWIRTMLFEISSIFYRYPASDGKQLLMLLRLIDYSVWRMRNNSEDTVCSTQTCCNGLWKHRRWEVTDEEKWTWPSATRDSSQWFNSVNIYYCSSISDDCGSLTWAQLLPMTFTIPAGSVGFTSDWIRCVENEKMKKKKEKRIFARTHAISPAASEEVLT